jgi:hypothetical protein
LAPGPRTVRRFKLPPWALSVNNTKEGSDIGERPTSSIMKFHT